MNNLFQAVLRKSKAEIVPSGLILDNYPTTGGAWSVNRLLRTGYGGNAIRVRRSSDSTEQDIGFVGGVLDTSTLLSFCSGTDGFVKTIYDQSGNGYDFNQTITGKQGRIVLSGVLDVLNGFPCVVMDGVNDFYDAGDVLSAPSEFTIFWVGVWAASTSAGRISKGIGASGNREYAVGHLGVVIFDEDTNLSSSFNDGISAIEEQELISAFYSDVSNILGYGKNGSYGSTTTNITIKDFAATLKMFSNPNTAAVTSGNFQECIMWLSDESVNNTAIANNINNTYSIY